MWTNPIDRPEDPKPTPEAFLQTLTPAELDGYLKGSLRIKRDAEGWHLVSVDRANNNSERQSSSAAAIPQVKYGPRQSNFLADDVSSINTTSMTAPQSIRDSYCSDCYNFHYPRTQHTLPEVPRRTVYGYVLPPPTPRGEVDMLEHFQERFYVELQRELWQLGLLGPVRKMKHRFERLWGSAKAKKVRLEEGLRSRLKNLRC